MRSETFEMQQDAVASEASASLAEDIMQDAVKTAGEELEDQYIPGTPLDYRKNHTDLYYAQYIEHFKQNEKPRRFYRACKRVFDFLVSLTMLLLLLPVFLVLAIAIKCDSKGPVIFKQRRVGKGGKEFYCYKFRTMKIEAPRECATSLLDNPEQYYTRVGRFLRKLSLDELPQLWCILMGKMSFIGYRPLILSEKNCNTMRADLGVFKFRPGISGYAQVHGRDKVYYKNKAIMDAEYVRDASLWYDLKLMFQTVWTVISKDGYES